MYPNETKLAFADRPMFAVDGELIAAAHEDDFTIAVELESDGGSGDPKVTIRSGARSVELCLRPDDALTLAEVLATYANANKRLAARPPVTTGATS